MCSYCFGVVDVFVDGRGPLQSGGTRPNVHAEVVDEFLEFDFVEVW